MANEARNRRRAAGRRTSLALRLSEDRPSVDAAPSAEASVLARELARDLLRAVDALGERDRAVIFLRYFLDLSESEMAQVLGCSRGTVKSRLSRALERLRRDVTAANRSMEALDA